MGYSAKTAKKLVNEKRASDEERIALEKQRRVEQLALEKQLKKRQDVIDRFIRKTIGEAIEVATSELADNFELKLGSKIKEEFLEELEYRGFKVYSRLTDVGINKKMKNLKGEFQEFRSLIDRGWDLIMAYPDGTRPNFQTLALQEWLELDNIVNKALLVDSDLPIDSFDELKLLVDDLVGLPFIQPTKLTGYTKLQNSTLIILVSGHVQNMLDIIDSGDLDQVVYSINWREPEDAGTDACFDFKYAANLNWLSSEDSGDFVQEILNTIQNAAESGQTSLKIYSVDKGIGSTVYIDKEKLVQLPFFTECLVDFFHCLEYKIEYKESASKVPDSIKLSWG